MTKYAIVFLTVLVAASCQNKQEDGRLTTDCLYAKPEPIFSNETDDKMGHHFSYDGVMSKEDLSFDDGAALQVIQSGCDHLKQEFRFRLPGTKMTGNPGFLISLAVRQFQRVAGLGPEYLVFEEWAEAIQQQSADIQPGRPAELQPGFYVKIEKESTQKDATLIITLSDQP